MRQLFSRLLAVALLLVACSGAVWGDNLTVTVTKSDGTQNTKTGQESLEKALAGYTLSEVEGIEVSAGSFEWDDWIWLEVNREDLKNLKKFVVTDGIESMADIPNTFEFSRHFSGALKELHIAKLKRVGDYAFSVCTGLTSVSLPVVTEIGEGAFSGCAGLTSLELGATPPSVGRDAFLGCPLVRKLKLVDAGGSPLTGDALANAIARYRAVEDGDTEDNLWYGWAFEEFPAGNLSGTIDGVAFTNAASLEAAMQGKTLGNVKELTITGGTFQIPDWAYLLEQGQAGLAIEKFTIESSVDRVADMPDLPYYSDRYLEMAQQVNIAKVKKIGKNAFKGCEGLTSVSLPVATEIGKNAFKGCEGLTSVSLPAATKIGEWAFYVCKGLTSVSLPAATEIGGYAFYYCEDLTSVSLPAAIEIGRSAFEGCEDLTSLELGATPPSVGRDAFLGCPLVRKLKLVDAGGTPLAGDALTNAISRYRAVEDGDTEDNLWYGWAFEDAPASNLSGTIDGEAFSNAASLEVAMKGKDLSKVKEVTITGGRIQVSDWGFLLEQGQHGLAIEKFTIENSVDRVVSMPDLPDGSPWYLPKAQQVNIAKIQKIGRSAFYGCTGLTSVSLPAATEIGMDAFNGCEGMTSVSLPAAKEIGNGAFGGCTGLTSVSLPAATEIGERAFRGCDGLTSVSLPAATEIGEYAFYGCKGLTSVSLPAATKIDVRAFADCTGLTSLQLGATPPRVDWEAFSGCPAQRTLIITDAAGVPLVGQALAAAGDKYYRDKRTSYGWYWYGWYIQDVTKMGSLEILPSDAGTVSITRKDGGAVVNPGDALARGELLIVTAASKSGYKYKKTTAVRAKDNGNNEWEVIAEFSQPVIFTVEFEKLATLGPTIKTPADAGELTIKRKEGGAVVKLGDALKEGAVLVVEGKPEDDYRVKSITAAGAKKIGEGNEWEVTALTGEQVVFTVEFEKLATLGATTITPAGAGEVTITRKDGGAVVSSGEALKEGAVLVVEGKPEVGYRVKAITAAGAKKIGDKEWEVTAMTGEVTFTVEFEKKPEGESNNPTPVESALLAQVQLSPNPTDGQVTIDAGTTLARCELYTGTGTLLQTIETPESVFTIDLTASPSGVYLVRLVDVNGESKTLRVVKQ